MIDFERTAKLSGVRVHNLKAIDLEVPLNRLVAICGVGGAGKSSLALDTLAVEGRRRYVETFSARARRFLDRDERPDAESIVGVPPALAIAGSASGRSFRSTVATMTDIQDHLAILYARLGRVHCRNCGATVAPSDAADVERTIEALPARTRYAIAFPLEILDETDLEALAASLRESGFLRVRVDETPFALADGLLPRPKHSAAIEVVVDRLVRGSDEAGRRRDSIETAFQKGLGRCLLIVENAPALSFARGWVCSRCGTPATAPEPRLFSFNSPLGACPSCEGLGFQALAEEKGPTRRRSRRGRRGTLCPACLGTRLKPESLAVTIGGLNIAQVSALSVVEAERFLSVELDLEAASPIAGRTLRPVVERLNGLKQIGLEYLTLDRLARTLSSGEARRVGVASALSSGLVNVLYVLDEPSNGLHRREIGRLIDVLKSLRDAGHSVVVVEHDLEILSHADHLIEVGPGAGEAGGQIVFAGRPSGLETVAESITGAFLSGRRRIPVPSRRRIASKGVLRLQGASGRNLKSIDVEFPLGLFCAVAGVSGSGKSTLIEQTLFPAVANALGKRAEPGLPFERLQGCEGLQEVVLFDQAPIGRLGRSNPATFLKVFDEIRKTFAATREARLRHYGAGRFSFNVPGGRCDACEGNGSLSIDMLFLPDVSIPCPECQGRRFRAETLEVTYRGKNIAEVLDLTARQAFGFFRNRPKVQARLRPLLEVGLDYLRLGQPSATLSSGEAQRLRLASRLAVSSSAIARAAQGPKTLFLLDEPTAGLHLADTERVLEALDSLVDQGHSLVAVEHDASVLLRADWIIELGPDSGPKGGEVVAIGTPEELAAGSSPTGRVLAEAIDLSKRLDLVARSSTI